MNLLAVDTAGKSCAVAVMRDDTLLYEAQCNNGLTHSETLLPTVDAVLKAAGKTCADIDLFGVCAGPGSFTGLRIGLCAAKGLAFPANTPCAAVYTLEALAWSHAGAGTVVAAQDARRGEVYWAAFDLATHQRITPDAASPVEEIRTVAETCPKPLLFVGDGAHLCESAFSAVPGVLPCPAALRVARAAGVCLAAKAMAERGETCLPAALLPSYHRLRQAERQRAERLAQTTEG